MIVDMQNPPTTSVAYRKFNNGGSHVNKRDNQGYKSHGRDTSRGNGKDNRIGNDKGNKWEIL